ncbi:apolipoprotein N-acyltransferase [Sinimarinibacterium sp. CAU 1509]|uniref:apolipoprotein N-acyltransferase n=1 Tax=Sinimarinibacterium sp. CAU 1509 TaxID=2562283 RepID=UPI0010AC03B8|nr:apolipoprotein N-acyltransferase [Sinimarinibacterium sp. CAU 1509]TJY56766.1 apolipoprotein N-acyltransferase [Sinimarinibacterium sp. CAU 1509]
MLKSLLSAVAASVLGAVMTLAFAPMAYLPLIPLCLAALFLLVRSCSARRAWLLGWLFGVGHFLGGVYWVFISTHTYGGAPAWVSVLMLMALVAYLGLFPAFVLYAAARLRLWQSSWGWGGLAALWLLSELARGWLLTGFPWLSLGYAATDAPLARLAPLLGVHGISVLLVLSAALIERAMPRVMPLSPPRRAVLLVLAALPWWLPPLLPTASAWTRPNGAALSVAVVQGNISQDQKWDRDLVGPILDRYLRMTESALGADLVVWPEVAVTQPYQAIRLPYLEALSAQARQAGSAVLAGMIIHADDGRGYYNGVEVLGRGSGRYTKRHLVPFGEYFPIPDFLRPVMAWIGTPYDDLLSGGDEQAPIAVHGERLGLSICFEDAFGRELRHGVGSQSLLVNLTNDAWFEGSSAPAQHLQIARMRALETGRMLVRAANTGISALIDADGRVLDSAGWNRTEILKGQIQPRAGLTPYARWGDWPLAVLALGLLAALVVGARRRPDAQSR